MPPAGGAPGATRIVDANYQVQPGEWSTTYMGIRMVGGTPTGAAPSSSRVLPGGEEGRGGGATPINPTNAMQGITAAVNGGGAGGYNTAGVPAPPPNVPHVETATANLRQPEDAAGALAAMGGSADVTQLTAPRALNPRLGQRLYPQETASLAGLRGLY